MCGTIPGYYTLVAAAAAIGFTKKGAEKAAKVEGWKRYKVGNVYLYVSEDVHEYRDHRIRRDLAKKLGWRGRGLYRNNDINIECPECGAFAIEWPAPPYLSEKFMCLKGHEGELK